MRMTNEDILPLEGNDKEGEPDTGQPQLINFPSVGKPNSKTVNSQLDDPTRILDG